MRMWGSLGGAVGGSGVRFGLRMWEQPTCAGERCRLSLARAPSVDDATPGLASAVQPPSRQPRLFAAATPHFSPHTPLARAWRQ